LADVVYSDIDPRLELDARGGIRILTNADAVIASVENIVGTAMGERPWLITFASRLKNLLFEPNDPLLIQQASQELITVIGEWDNRPIIQSVDFFQDKENGQISVQVRFTIAGLPGEYLVDRRVT